MKTYLLLLAITSSMIITSCASVLSPKSQEITVKNDALNAKISIGTDFNGKGVVVSHTINKNFYPEQIIVQADGYKPDYYCAVLNNSSPLYYLSWLIPIASTYMFFSAVGDAMHTYAPTSDEEMSAISTWLGISVATIGIPFIDHYPSRWSYEDTIHTEKLIKYPKWDKSQKRIFLDNVSIDLNNERNKYYRYSYENYLKGKINPYNTYTGDSTYNSNSVYEENIGKILRKYNYIDTNNTIFVDNINSLIIHSKIKGVEINEIDKKFTMIRNTQLFFQVDLESEWLFTDIYGDTLFIDTLKVPSGEFSIDHYCKDYNELFRIYTDYSKAILPAIADAVEVSMISFLDSPKTKEFIKIEYPKNDFEPYFIKKSNNKPTNISTAMQATVTIKHGKSHGSGFFISNDGYIITNHHVIHDKGEYIVITNDGKEHKAKIIRSNKAYDLALIKIEGDFEYAFNIPDKKNYSVGENIFAIGTPKDIQLGQSISKGIISNSRKYKDYTYIQSDVTVNSGNSGGPIINKQGELISVVKSKLFGYGTEGISFSIPAPIIYKALEIKY